MAESQHLVPGLPEELALECLTRIHPSAHRSAACVSRAWRQLLESTEYYHRRKQNGLTCLMVCFIQAIKVGPTPEPTPTGPPTLGITLFDVKHRTWDRVDLESAFPNGLPLYCHMASSEGKLVMVGGWDPVSYDPTCHVSIYDFMVRKWKRGQDMPAKRSLFAIGAIDGRIIIAGGHDLGKNASNSAWVYDVSRDEWTELPRMSEERDECQGLVIGREFWVISGYGTESQGEYKPSADVYNIETGQWKRVEDIWSRGHSPKLCVGLGPNGELMNWAKPNSVGKHWKYAIDLGGEIIAYDGEIPGLSIVNKKRYVDLVGDCGEVEKLDVPNEFLGFVQSGCCVEI